MNILFWNLNKKSITDKVVNCLVENNIDIALFSEFSGIAFNKITSDTDYKYFDNISGCDKITMVASPDVKIIQQIERSRYIIYQIMFKKCKYNVVGIHLEDRRNNPENAIRLITIRDIIGDISETEENYCCDNTIVIGDFNANPFDVELLQIDAFNAVLFKDLIFESETAVRNNFSYRRFYNPTLNFLSENSKNYGSFYYNKGENTPIWNSFDQVIVRKSLVNSVEKISYLRTIGSQSLMSAVKPNTRISDHLPLLVKLS